MAHLGKIPKLANLEASYRQSDTKRSHRLLQSSAVLNLSVFKEARHSKDFATAPKSTRYCKKRRNTRGKKFREEDGGVVGAGFQLRMICASWLVSNFSCCCKKSLTHRARVIEGYLVC